MILTDRDKDLIARVVRWEQQHGYVAASEAERRRTALQASILVEGGGGNDDQLANLTLPDGWQEAGGDYTHPTLGTVHNAAVSGREASNASRRSAALQVRRRCVPAAFHQRGVAVAGITWVDPT